MERGVSVGLTMRRFLFLPLIFALHGDMAWSQGTRTLVLATSANSTIPALTIQETRKLFLGVPLEKNGESIVPVLNTSDPLLHEVFLQKVTFMSSPAYETQLISTVFRLGGKRPNKYGDGKELIDALRKNPHAVTYLWQDQVDTAQGIKAVSVVWTGSTE